MPGRLDFPRRARLSRDREYQRVYAAGLRRSLGPLTLHALPNTLAHHRLGLSVGKRVGPAVERNRAKRLIREAFRLERATLAKRDAGAYDLVVSLRGPLRLTLDALRAALRKLLDDAHGAWDAREQTP